MADKFTVADIKSALASKLFPTVTVWNRLEGRPRTANFERALRAEVRDALWGLARQKQVGEWQGEDAGSPVLAKVRIATTRLTRFRAGDADAEDFDETIPLETQVERKLIPWQLGSDKLGLDLRVVIGRRWLKLVGAIADYGALFIDRYKIALPDPTRPGDSGICAHPEVWQSVAAVAERTMDGVALYQYLKGGASRQAYDGIAVLAVHKPAIGEAAHEFVAWVERLIEQPDSGDNPAWQPERLEYRFACSAPTADGERKLIADEYYSGTLDWYALDVDPSPTPLGTGAAVDPRDAIVRTMIPVPVRYAGMPNARWWAFEDGKTNFGQIRPDTTDLAKLLFVEFGLVYSNDWFLVPITLEAGSVATVEGLAVSNVFGERFWIQPIGSRSEDAWERWSMYASSTKGAVRETPSDTSLLILPTVAKVQEGAPMEEIAFVRDEMANMVWAVERMIPAADGHGKRGAEAARETRAYFERLLASGAVLPAPPAAAPIRYEVMNQVPEHWIPFMPVHARGSEREIDLQRGALPRVIRGDPDPPLKVRPRTSLLRTGLDEKKPTPYLVREEEVPRAGIHVSMAFQRTRGYDGRVFVWLGVRKETGRGEASSGLAFDKLRS
jgi:hypothetical protein